MAVQDLLHYDQITGHFFWKKPRRSHLIGERAGFLRGKYWAIKVGGKVYKASRLAWFFMTGEWPKGQIDHIDGNRLNDGFSNLREATNSQNCRNRAVKSTNKLGIKGVCVSGKMFRAQLYLDGRAVLDQRFDTVEEAKHSYDMAASRFHGDYARL